MAYATSEDVAVRWGREMSSEEAALVEVRLEDVERMIRRRIPDLDAQVEVGLIDVEDVVQVESDAVLRLARNPEGYYSETDGNYTYMLQQGIVSGVLDITDDEWAILGIVRDRFFTLRPYAQVDSGTYVPPTTPRSLWRRDIEEIRKDYRVIDWTRQVW
jgi:hypothetical protein